MKRIRFSQKILISAALSVGAPLALATPQGTGDLTGDSTFPTAFVDNPTSGGSNDRAVAVVASDSGGYWLIGSSNADDGMHATPVVTEYSSTGVAQLPAFYASNTDLSSLTTIVGAAKGVNNGVSRVYVVGDFTVPGFTDSDFGVVCLSPAHAFQACAGFGTNGHVSIDFDRGGTNNDFATAVAYDASSGAVYIAGDIDIGGRTAIGVARIDGITGARDSDWGNAATTDGTFVYADTFTPNGSAYAFAITAGSPRFFSEDVFVVGNAAASATDTTDRDGVILPIDAVNGAGFDSGWSFGHVKQIFFDLGTTQRGDFLNAVMLRNNGELVVAGQARGDNNLAHLILAEYDGQGKEKLNFCGGKGVCDGPLFNYPDPTAIAERPGTGDLIIAANNHDDSGAAIQGIYEIDSRGYSLIAYDETTWYSNAGTTPSSITNAVMVDSANRVIEAGARRWDSPTFDYDMTIRRWVATDTIFGNSFGGKFID